MDLRFRGDCYFEIEVVFNIRSALIYKYIIWTTKGVCYTDNDKPVKSLKKAIANLAVEMLPANY